MDLCRLCYSCTYPELRQNIFNEKFDPPIWEIIADFSNLEIRKDDPYPKIVCVHCFVELKNFYTFRQMMLNTDYRIRQNRLDEDCPTDRNDCIETVFGETPLSSDLQHDYENESISGDNKSKNNSNRIEIKDEISIDETEPSNENLNELSCPIIKINLDDILKEGIEEQPLKTAKNDKIEENYENTNKNTDELKIYPNKVEHIKNINKKTDQMGGFAKTSKSTIARSSKSGKVLKKSQKRSQISNEKDTTEKIAYMKYLHINSKQHIDGNLFQCNYCDKQYTKKRSFGAHLKVHISEKPYHCHVCGKKFPYNLYLQRHLRIHTDEKPYQCEICGRRYLREFNLREHLRTHTNERPYNCDICGKTFRYKQDSQRHLRIHTGERPCQCNVCGKTFTTISGLCRHLKIHTGEKPYQCNVCNKKFLRSKELKNHSTVHTGEQPYSCSTCGKKFSRSDNLRKHSKIHTGEKPYQCNICDRRFLYKHVLRDHLKTHPSDKSFDCNKCSLSFVEESFLTAHLKQQHNYE